MDNTQKITLKAEITMLKSLASGLSGQTAMLSNPNYPVVGTMVTIPSLPMAAQAFNMQNDIITRLLTLLDKVIDAA